jgi:DNA-binding NtrC family response regulator
LKVAVLGPDLPSGRCWATAKSSDEGRRKGKGTAASDTHQKNRRRAQADPVPGEVAVPEQVIVSMAEIAESAREVLLALAVGTGLQVMAARLSPSITRSSNRGTPPPNMSCGDCST